MERIRLRLWRWLAAAVIVHLVVSMIHGAAHQGADVPLSWTANLFVYTVILAGPLVGLALTWPAERLGNWTVAASMTGSLIFGCVNHFILAGPDHVAHVAAAWRTSFGVTAGLLAITEAFGAGVAARLLAERKRS